MASTLLAPHTYERIKHTPTLSQLNDGVIITAPARSIEHSEALKVDYARIETLQIYRLMRSHRFLIFSIEHVCMSSPCGGIKIEHDFVPFILDLMASHIFFFV